MKNNSRSGVFLFFFFFFFYVIAASPPNDNPQTRFHNRSIKVKKKKKVKFGPLTLKYDRSLTQIILHHLYIR